MDMIGFLYCLWETVVFSHSGAAMADFIEQLIFFFILRDKRYIELFLQSVC